MCQSISMKLLYITIYAIYLFVVLGLIQSICILIVAHNLYVHFMYTLSNHSSGVACPFNIHNFRMFFEDLHYAFNWYARCRDTSSQKVLNFVPTLL